MKRIFFMLLIGILLFANCGKISDAILKPFTIQGTLLKDCSGQPLAGVPVKLWYSAGSSLGPSSTDLGETITDAEGNFTFGDIARKYNGGIYVLVEGKTWYQQLSPATLPDNNILHWTLYQTYDMIANVKLEINNSSFASIDTLYVNTFGTTQIFYPIPTHSFYTFKQTYTSRIRLDSTAYKGWWAIGKSFFDSLHNTWPVPSEWKNYLFTVVAKPCLNTDTTVIMIP